jgi:hypothetical protein
MYMAEDLDSDISHLAESSRQAGQRVGRELMENSGEYPSVIRDAILGYMERERGADLVCADRVLYSGVDEKVAIAIKEAAAECLPSSVDDTLRQFCEGAFLEGVESSTEEH